jgi:hypothetical protein
MGVTVPEWIQQLTNLNLMSILDIALDLRDASQLDPRPTISALPDVVRFAALMPTDGINMRDRYMELRAAALRFLKDKGVVSALLPVLNPYAHRWQSRVQVDLDPDVLLPVVAALQKEYASRTNEKQTQQSSLAVVALPIDRLRDLALRFHGVVMALRTRYGGRATLDVSDEYDVQDLMRALLATLFDDVRPEEYVPSYGGGRSRTDFLLKKEQVVLELKKTRAGLADKQLGDELIIDSARYAAHPDCKTLVCIVYDPENRIINPSALQADLSGNKNGISVDVIIVPKLY